MIRKPNYSLRSCFLYKGQVGFLVYQYDINKNIIGNGPVARSIKIDVDKNQTIITYTFTGLDPNAKYILINTDDEWSLLFRNSSFDM